MNLYKLSGNKFGCDLDMVIPLLEINSQEILNRKEKQKLLFIKIFTAVFTAVLFIIGANRNQLFFMVNYDMYYVTVLHSF